MNEIKEIMNGNIKIFNMRIEGETIGFDTPYNSNWNFMARDFEQIIDTLQQENARLKDKIEKIEEWLKYKTEALDTFDIPKRKETGAFWFTTRGEIDGLLEILKEN